MKGNIPIQGDDFISVTATGYKFGVGLNNPTGEEEIMSLTVEKAPGSGNPLDSATWQHQLQEGDPVFKCVQKFAGDMLRYYVDFLDRAHAKLVEVTGSGLPEWPENDLEQQLRWLIKYGTSYSASGFTVKKP